VGRQAVSVNGDVPTRVPDGVTHLEHVMGEAAAAFQRNDFHVAIGNLAHAVYVASVEDEDVSEPRVRELMCDVLGAIGWERTWASELPEREQVPGG